MCIYNTIYIYIYTIYSTYRETCADESLSTTAALQAAINRPAHDTTKQISIIRQTQKVRKPKDMRVHGKQTRATYIVCVRACVCVCMCVKNAQLTSHSSCLDGLDVCCHVRGHDRGVPCTCKRLRGRQNIRPLNAIFSNMEPNIMDSMKI